MTRRPRRAACAPPPRADELRLGQAASSPAVELRIGPEIGLKQLTGLELAAEDGKAVSCPPGGGSVGDWDVGDPRFRVSSWSNPSFGCTTTIPGGATSVVVGQGGGAWARFEEGRRRGLRDGVIDRAWGWQAWGFDLAMYDGSRYLGGCSYRFDPAARLDVYDPGHGHRIVYDQEALFYVAPTGGAGDYGSCPSDGDPESPDATVSQQLRMRAWTPAPIADPFTQAVWLQRAP